MNLFTGLRNHIKVESRTFMNNNIDDKDSIRILGCRFYPFTPKEVFTFKAEIFELTGNAKEIVPWKPIIIIIGVNKGV